MSDDAAILMQNQKIILFDAQCKLCSAWCNFIIAHDTNTIFKLCSVQSPKGELLLAHFGFSTIEITFLFESNSTESFINVFNLFMEDKEKNLFNKKKVAKKNIKQFTILKHYIKLKKILDHHAIS